MKRILMTAICAAVLLTGCATMNLPDTATQADKAEAICKDAQTAYLLSVSMLDQTLPPDALTYWNAYKAGAQAAISAYCSK